jgi:hypothetical protein
MQKCGSFNLTCSIYFSFIKEYVCSPNDMFNACSPIHAFSLKKSTPNIVTLQYSLSITIISKKKLVFFFFFFKIFTAPFLEILV